MSSSIPAAAAVAAATVADEGPPEPPQQLEQEQEQEQEQRPRDKGEEEATARLAVYMDAALPYSPDDWVRVNCQGCLHNKRFYCPTCLRILGAPPTARVPQLALPIRIDLVLADYVKKSTGIQAAAIAPGSIHVHTFPKELKTDWDPAKTLVIYPSEDAVTLDAIDPQELAGMERFVLLDSRWNNTTRVLEHEAIKRLTRKVKLRAPPSSSRFWRYHSKGDGHLSSVEALYYLLSEYAALTGKTATWVSSSTTTDGDGDGDGGGKNNEEQAPAAAAAAAAPLEELFFLFRIQSRVIKDYYDQWGKEGLPNPMEEAGKERLRSFRCYQGLANKEKSKARKAAKAEERRKRREELRDQQQKRQRHGGLEGEGEGEAEGQEEGAEEPQEL